MCINCNNTCIDDVPIGCVTHTGPDYPKLGIKHGEPYDKITMNLFQQLEDMVSETVELKCLYDDKCGKCSPNLEIPEAVQVVIDKICTLTTNDIRHVGNWDCVNSEMVSSSNKKLLDSYVNYTVKPEGLGTMITYDVNELVKNLPSSHRISKVNTTISGKAKRNRTIIAETDKSFAGVIVDNDRFPILLDVKMNVNTPDGDVMLTKSISIPSPMTGNYVTPLNIKDYTTSKNDDSKLNTFLDSMSNQTCMNTRQLNMYKNIQLAGCDGMKLPSGDALDIIAYMWGVICDLEKRVTELGNVNFSLKGDKCGDTEHNTDIQGGFEALAKSCSQAHGKINSCSK